MTDNIQFCFAAGTNVEAEIVEDSGYSREQWSAMSGVEQDEAVQAWMPARSGVVWVVEP